MNSATQTKVGPDDLAVLYVDDESGNLLVFRLSYGDELRVLCARSGSEALAILATEPVGVVVADQRMPKMTGIELFAILRERYPDVTRVLVTAYSDRETAIDAINRGGVDRYVEKPWNAEQFRALLHEAAEHARLRASLRALRHALVERERRAIAAPIRAAAFREIATRCRAVDERRAALSAALADVKHTLSPAAHQTMADELQRLTEATAHLAHLGDASGSGALREGAKVATHSVSDLLRDAVALVRADLPVTMQVTTSCPDDLSLCADAVDVCAILTNLVSIAAQAGRGPGRATGEIRLVGRGSDDATQILVGNGRPARGGEMPGEPGTLDEPALGLAMARALAESNRGSVVMASRDDADALFVVTLPPREPAL